MNENNVVQICPIEDSYRLASTAKWMGCTADWGEVQCDLNTTIFSAICCYMVVREMQMPRWHQICATGQCCFCYEIHVQLLCDKLQMDPGMCY